MSPAQYTPFMGVFFQNHNSLSNAFKKIKKADGPNKDYPRRATLRQTPESPRRTTVTTLLRLLA